MEHRARSISAAGFSYVEILLSIVLVGVLLVPALEALQGAIAGTPASSSAPSPSALHAKMEQVVAAPFSKLYAETYATGGNTTTSASPTFSDASGATPRRIVVIYRYDALLRTLATADTGLVYVSTYYESEGPAGAVSTLVGRWW